MALAVDAPSGATPEAFQAVGRQLGAACERLSLMVGSTDHGSSAAARALLPPVAHVLADLVLVGTGALGDLAPLQESFFPRLRSLALSCVPAAEAPVLVTVQVRWRGNREGGALASLGRTGTHMGLCGVVAVDGVVGVEMGTSQPNQTQPLPPPLLVQAPRLGVISLDCDCWGTAEERFASILACAAGRPRPLGWVATAAVIDLCTAGCRGKGVGVRECVWDGP